MASRPLSSINLNQLLALDALLAEGSVTRAAKQIGVSQSALSHTLSALRDVFGDPLLIRGSEGMVLSERAEQLGGPLRRTLLDLEGLLQTSPEFDPSVTEREFRLATADFIAVHVATCLVGVFADRAPGARLTVRPLPNLAPLERGDFDAVIGPHFDPGVAVQQRAWRDERFACVVRKDHPAVGDSLTLDAYVKLAHVLVSPTGSGAAWVDEALETQGLRRHIALRAPSFLIAPIVVARSDLILTAPEAALAPFIDAFGLRRVDPPVELAPLALELGWHRRSTDDPAQKWFRQLLIDAGLRP